MVTCRSFDSAVRQRSKSGGYDSGPIAVLDALSNDTDRAQNG